VPISRELLVLIRRKPKGNDRDCDDMPQEESRPHPARIEKPVQPAPHQEEHATMTSEKWASITQEFLVTTKMINLSLVKVSYN
jgi:hypothetical protein